MPRWLKILLIVAIVVVLGILAVVGTGVIWWMKNKDPLMARAREVVAEGKNFGKHSDNQACVDEAQLDAAYRFFDNDHIAPPAILASHIQATLARCVPQPTILAVQDTTLLDYTHHPATTGLGPLASPTHQGLLVHSTLALTPDRLPLGLLAQHRWTRDPTTVGKSDANRSRIGVVRSSRRGCGAVSAGNAMVMR